MKLQKLKLNWTNIIYFSLSPLVAIAGTIWIMSHGGPHWATWVLTLVMLYATGLGITSGYHRLLAHKTYETKGPMRLLLLLLGGASLEGSAKEWCSDHRTHHRFIDTDKDPYNIQKGFWWAHLGWILVRSNPPSLYDNVADLNRDPLVRFQHRYYLPLVILVSFVFPTALASLWGDFWGGLIIAGLARVVFNQHATFCINSFCHTLGTQPYSTKHSGRDSWLTALFTYGEGYHNFHHEFPYDYRNGLRAYQWDPGKWLIAVLSWMGLAHNLHRAKPAVIFQAKLKLQAEQWIKNLEKQPGFIKNHKDILVAKTRDQLIAAYAQVLHLKQEYRRLKQEKINQVNDRLIKVRADMKKARGDFKKALEEWQVLLQRPMLEM